MGRKIDADDLVLAQDIADRVDLAHYQQVHSWRTRHPDFPAPVREWGRIRIWYWPDVEAWLRSTGRLRK
ncbi:MAG TPA: hypothetical protein VEW93_10725 [Acidimicrobiales bacterium]|nr:hypothetical protein [Acidimicrobiales bacterium]